MDNIVITISRQVGVGGTDVAKKVSSELGIAYYDKELIKLISNKIDMSQELIKTLDESTINKIYPLNVGNAFSIPQLSVNDKIEIAESEIIANLASKQSCVIVGRCAYDIVDDKALKVLLYSTDMDKRIKRCFEQETDDSNLTEKEMLKYIKNMDKKRADYNNFYTNKDWLSIGNFNLCIDMAKVSIVDASEIICKLVK